MAIKIALAGNPNCGIKSRKNFTARFNVRAPGEDDYSIRESREYQSGGIGRAHV